MNVIARVTLVIGVLRQVATTVQTRGKIPQSGTLAVEVWESGGGRHGRRINAKGIDVELEVGGK